MFWKKGKKKQSLDFVADGVQEIQLFICPNCGLKKEKPLIIHRCAVCDMALCYSCQKEVWFSTVNRGYFCSKHYYWICSEFDKLITHRKKGERVGIIFGEIKGVPVFQD